MRRKTIVLSLLILVVVAFAAIVPAAFAGQVTRIMLAQENVDVYMYKATTAGNFTASGAWKNQDNSPGPIWPAGSVNVILQTGTAPLLYEDLDVADLYDTATNPVTNNALPVALVAGQEIWIAVNPYVGDYKYTLTVNFTGTGQWYGKDGLGTPESVTTKSVDGQAYASDGEVFVRTVGQWYGVGQYWPGDEALNTALTNWNLYSVERSDYVSGTWPEWTYPNSWTSNTAMLYTGSGTTDSSTMANGNLGPSQIGRWYSVTPQTWSAAKVPNEWPTGTGFRYPRPGSITYTQAPLWMTYSFADAAATKPGYSWNTLTTASASKRNWSTESAQSGRITWRFQGPDFSWIYTKGPRAGIANVTIDGGTAIPVDQYNAGVVYQQKTDFAPGGAVDAWHDVVITGSGGSSGVGATRGFYLYHDAFVDPDETTPYAENNYDGQTTYRWSTVNSASASGGVFCSASAIGATTAFTFQCNSNTAAQRVVKWTYAKGPRCGKVNIYIDGVFQEKLDLYAAGVTFNQVWTSVPLTKTWHTIMVIPSGESSGVGGTRGFFTYSDAWQAEAQTPVEAE